MSKLSDMYEGITTTKPSYYAKFVFYIFSKIIFVVLIFNGLEVFRYLLQNGHYNYGISIAAILPIVMISELNNQYIEKILYKVIFKHVINWFEKREEIKEV